MNTGKLGEKVAAVYLFLKGYQILGTNKKFKYKEVDLICKKGKTLIFVEVKTRSQIKGGRPEEAVDQAKLKNLETAIYSYLLKYDSSGITDIKIEVISIEFKNKLPHIHHFKNIYFD